FVYGGGIYGSTTKVFEVDVLSQLIILIKWADEDVLDDAYYDVDNYELMVVDGVGEARVLRVLNVTKGNTALHTAIITDRMTYGVRYRINVKGIHGRSGLTGEGSSEFISRATKTDSILRSLPNHFDKRPESTIANILLAISRQDDLIGGSRKDTFVAEGPYTPPVLPSHLLEPGGDYVIDPDSLPILIPPE